MALLTELTKTQVKGILEQYPLAPLKSFSSIEGGALNSSFYLKLEDNSKFVLTICENKSRTEMNQMTELLRELNSQDIPTTKVLLNKEGGAFGEIAQKYYFLKEFIEGNNLTEDTPKNILGEVGQFLGKLHNSSLGDLSMDNKHLGEEFVASILDEIPAGNFKEWLLEKKTFLDQNFPKTSQKGLVHGDVFADNILVSKNHLQGVIDFELASIYPYTFDLGSALVGCCHENPERLEETLSELIKGYEKERKLEPQDIQDILYFAIYNATYLAGWRYREYEVRQTSSSQPKDYRSMQILSQKCQQLFC